MIVMSVITSFVNVIAGASVLLGGKAFMDEKITADGPSIRKVVGVPLLGVGALGILVSYVRNKRVREDKKAESDFYEAELYDAENDPDFDPVKADRNKDGKISSWERSVGNAIAKSMRENKGAEDFGYDDFLEYHVYVSDKENSMGFMDESNSYFETPEEAVKAAHRVARKNGRRKWVMVIAENRDDDYEDIVYEIDNMGQINRNYQYGRHPTSAMQEIQRFGAESKFDKLEDEIAAQYRKKGMSKEEADRIGAATAAKIGFKKYGKKGMVAKAKKGRRAETFENQEQTMFETVYTDDGNDEGCFGCERTIEYGENIMVGEGKMICNDCYTDPLNDFGAETFEAPMTIKARPNKLVTVCLIDLSGSTSQVVHIKQTDVTTSMAQHFIREALGIDSMSDDTIFIGYGSSNGDGMLGEDVGRYTRVFTKADMMRMSGQQNAIPSMGGTNPITREFIDAVYGYVNEQYQHYHRPVQIVTLTDSYPSDYPSGKRAETFDAEGGITFADVPRETLGGTNNNPVRIVVGGPPHSGKSTLMNLIEDKMNQYGVSVELRDLDFSAPTDLKGGFDQNREKRDWTPELAEEAATYFDEDSENRVILGDSIGLISRINEIVSDPADVAILLVSGSQGDDDRTYRDAIKKWMQYYDDIDKPVLMVIRSSMNPEDMNYFDPHDNYGVIVGLDRNAYNQGGDSSEISLENACLEGIVFEIAQEFDLGLANRSTRRHIDIVEESWPSIRGKPTWNPIDAGKPHLARIEEEYFEELKRRKMGE